MTGYTAHTTIGTEQRGAAIVRGTMALTSTEKLPNGRGIAALCEQTLLVNIYGPSGGKNRKDRETCCSTCRKIISYEAMSTVWYLEPTVRRFTIRVEH
jgi:hypothetical protein